MAVVSVFDPSLPDRRYHLTGWQVLSTDADGAGTVVVGGYVDPTNSHVPSVEVSLTFAEAMALAAELNRRVA